MVISSKSPYENLKVDENNVHQNRMEAFARFIAGKDKIFVGMDSDVVLWPGVVEELVGLLEKHDVVIWPDKHNLFAVQRTIIEKFPLDEKINNGKCSLCNYFELLKKAGVDVYTAMDCEPVHDDHF